MTKEAMIDKRAIGNVGVLDLRQAGEESVAGIQSIGNVGIVLYTPETAGLITRLKVGNIGSTVEVAADAQLRSGREHFTRSTFQNRSVGAKLIVSGQLIVEPDVARDDLAGGLDELVVFGKILCPEHLVGALQRRLRHLDGELEVYRQDASLLVGEVRLDLPYLQTLADDSALMVAGSLAVPDTLPNELLAQKIGHLQVSRRITCHEANAATLLARLDKRAARPQLTVIPAGHTLVSRPLLLDNSLLETLPARKLYCTEMVRIAADVSAERLDETLEALVATDIIICPAALQKVLSTKIDVLATQAIFYEGDLWLIEDVANLNAGRFSYLDGKATLVVPGVLTIDPDVIPQLLAERLAKVHNLGVITGTAEQLAALQTRLGLQEGVFEASGADALSDGGLGNINYLQL